MSKTTGKNIVVPGAEDDILASLETMADSMGVIVHADSIASARTILTRMEAEGKPPTRNNPAFFSIHNNLYQNSGEKPDGVWTLNAMNEVEFYETTFAQGGTKTLNVNEFFWAMQIDIPARPYPRLLTADGSMYGRIVKGYVDLALNFSNSTRTKRARWEPRNNGESGVSTMLQARIPEGVSVTVRCGPVGQWGTDSQVSLTTDTNHNWLVAQAVPLDAR